MFNVTVGSRPIVYSLLKFSGGELHPRITDCVYTINPDVTIKGNIYSPSEVLELFLLVDALRREFIGKPTFNLICPYLPYARQDRVCAQGEALGRLPSLASDFLPVERTIR